MNLSIGFFLKKKYIQWSEWWKNFKKKRLSAKKPEINSTQAKSIELFYALLKDKQTKLNYSKTSHTRVIDSELVWMTMSTFDLNHYTLQIIDETKKHAHTHDVIIPKEYGYEMADEFDEELEKRFRAIDAAKRNHITVDLDALVKKIKNNKLNSSDDNKQTKE